MSDKKKVVNRPETWLVFTVLTIMIVILGFIVFKKPSITGEAILGKESAHSDNLNLKINESGTYEWKPNNPGNIKSLKVTGSVTSNGTARVYIEKNGTRQLLFDSTKQLFDVDIHVLPDYKNILQGGEILIQNTLFNLRGFGSGNINVKYAIKDPKGNVIAAEEETVFVATQAKFIRKLVIPKEIEPGTFTAFVEASTNGTIVGTGSDTFEIVSKSKQPYLAQLKYYIGGIAAIIAFVILFIVGIYGYNKFNRQRKVTELKKTLPLERIKKLEKELNALEEARKSGFISQESFEKEKKRLEEKLGVSKK